MQHRVVVAVRAERCIFAGQRDDGIVVRQRVTVPGIEFEMRVLAGELDRVVDADRVGCVDEHAGVRTAGRHGLLQIDAAVARRQRERVVAVPCDRTRDGQVVLGVGQRDVRRAEVARQRIGVDRAAGVACGSGLIDTGVAGFDRPRTGYVAGARIDDRI
ncbi:MAG: hypothetical protein LBJ65_04955, partial [Burkholderia sp.]|uniref:hypothetical protein n=1 Tax=Burkholderia sp. TaxID=36773 RepID=UPI00281D7D2E